MFLVLIGIMAFLRVVELVETTSSTSSSKMFF
jgi:hypothetical protein